MVARQATECLIDLRCTPRSFGAPLDGPAWLLSDNKSVVTSSTIPHSSLSKRWNALSYHKVREAIASGWLRFEHLPGTKNPADMLMKPLPWFKLRAFVEILLFWKGNVADAPSGPSLNPEGSDASLGPTRDPMTHDSSRGANANRQVEGNASFNVLWNNQHAALADSDV